MTAANSLKKVSFENHLNQQLKDVDAEIFHAIQEEWHRQEDQIELIASENIVSNAVLAAMGSLLTNKYAEGYPGNRYYGGCEHVDVSERLAITRACELFGCTFANVQPHSGSQANQAVMLALLKPNDTILGMALDAGGHLTHGAAPNLSGKWFHAVSYGVRPQDGLIDYDQVATIAKQSKPALLIAGGSAYSRIIDFGRMRAIADEVGALLMVDMAHFAGLVAAGIYPSPFPHAHIVTTTTHKTLRGPRGGMILTNDVNISKKINSAVFPGLQGGPLMHVIAAKAVAFKEALDPSFKDYATQIVKNAQTLANELIKGGLDIVSGGTDSHLLTVDLRKKNVTGKHLTPLLEAAGITCNKNTIPDDPYGPFVTAGVRLGTPAATTRGFKEKEFQQVAAWILRIVNSLSEPEDRLEANLQEVRAQVKELCLKFPLYKTPVSAVVQGD